MRTVASEMWFRKRRGQAEMGARAAALRNARRRTLALESLESRVLLATLPAITHAPNAPVPIDLAQTGSAPSGGATNAADGSILAPTTNTGTIENESSPTIAIDPNNPQKLVAVYTTNIRVVTTATTTDTTTIEGAYSTNAGLSWTSFSVAPVKTIDPQTSAAFLEITNATVAFDHNDNFYVASQENNINDETGAVFLERYSFTGAAPSTDQLATAGASKMIYGPWNTVSQTAPTGSEVLSLSLAVDSDVSSFTDPTNPSWSVKDNNTGNVYVALGVDTPVNATTNNYNIQLVYSNNLGVAVSNPPLVVSSETTAGYPQLTVEQGGPGSGVNIPGQVAIVWDNFSTAAPVNGGAIETRVFTPTTGSSPPTGTLGPEVAAFASIPTVGLTSGFSVVSGTPGVSSSNVPNYPVTYSLNGTNAPVSPTIGVGPAPVIASDNTLGAFSQNQGELYVAFVGHSLATAATSVTSNSNPAGNTDIYLITSTNGGLSWSFPVKVDQDNATTDGFSEADTVGGGTLASNSGRTQFMPSIAVDQTTGTLVVSWLDTRNDAANARYATYITTSIDGGQTFAPDTYANAPDTAFNTITQQNVILGPIPDDQSTGNPNADQPSATLAGYTFGNHQGLAVYAGHVYAAWSGDESGGVNESMRLNILIAPMVIAAGPRIVSSTMGVATPLTIPVPAPGGATMINTRDPVTGIPQFDGFFVQFDRYVNPATFTPAEIQVSYLAPGAASAVLVSLTNVSIVSQDLRPSSLGVESFLVTFSPLEGVGTYSYAIGPGISDRIRTATATGVLISSGNEMDQNADAQPGELELDQYETPRALNGIAFQSPYDPTTLPIIIPGPSIISTAALDANGNPIAQQTDGENLALDTDVTGVQVTFDRDMRVGSFVPSDILSLVGPIGPVPGPFTIQVVPGSLRVFNIFFATPQTLSGSYVVTISPNIYSVVNSDPTRTTGDPVDANGTAALVQLRGGSTANGTTTFTASNNTVTPITPGTNIQVPITISSDFTISSPVTVSLNITFPTDPALVVSLLVIDPNNSSDDVTIPLFSRIGAGLSTANFTNTTFSDIAALPIQDASAPFSGTFQVETGLGSGGKTVTLDSLSGRSAKAIYILQISDTGTDVGQLNDWSISMGEPVLNDGLGQSPSTVPFQIFVMDPTDPQSLSTWTAVGPTPTGDPTGVFSDAGAVTATAVDPSDPSGNTVYVGAANGGIWKTTDFLTTSPQGPTWIPLTDFGPTNAVNIGSIAIFPRNNDPSQSIIIAGTGDPNGTTTTHGLAGVGFLRSEDGGATWQLLDSTVNTEADGVTPLPINGPSPTSGLTRNHTFVGSYVYNVTFDPNLSVSGGVIVYAAVNGPTASSAASGVWRSMDGGNTWTLLKAGQATSVSLDLYSGTKDVNGNPIGNATTIFVAFGNDPNGNDGVWKSTNFGQSFALMTGGQGDPEVQNTNSSPASTVPVTNDAVSPNGTNGRIILTKPNLIPSASPNAVIENQLYEGWLYALVVNTNDTLNGLYVTKDAGLNWTKVAIATSTTVEGGVPGTPSNNAADTALNIVGNYNAGRSASNTPQGNDDLVMTIDPTNPNIVYIGGAGPDSLIQVNITTLQDLYSFDLDSETADGGKLTSATTASATLVNATTPPATFRANIGSPSTAPTLNLLRNPTNPLGGSGTIFVANTASLNNSGAGATWMPETTLLGDFGGDPFEYDLIAVPDPLTGGTRLIATNNDGVWTGVLGSNGQILQNIGDVTNDSVASTSADVPIVTYTRNGNLQIGQFYYGAVQPNSAAAQVAGALLYAQSQVTGGAPYSAPDLLTSGNLAWDTTTPLLAASSESASSTVGGFVTTDPSGSGTVFQYQNPQGGVNTNFFKVDGLGQTNGLSTAGGPNPDPQWPDYGPFTSSAGTPFGQFAVNPVDDQKILIGSETGLVYATSNQGDTWTVVASGTASGFDGNYVQALAYGAPQPSDPTGANDTFYYAGTTKGDIYVTFTGGGTTANWTNITNGALAGNSTPILQIITNPNRGSNAAYAITTNGVYYIADSNQTDPVPTAMKQWVKVTGNLLTTQSNPLFNNPLVGTSVLTQYLTSMAIDWRYQIPNNPTVTATATAQIGSINGVSTGALGLIVVDNGGQGYTSANPPTVTISGGGGSGATGAAVVNSSGVVTGISLTGVLSIDISNGGGTNYSAASPPLVTIAGGGGTGATATAVVTNETVNGVVTGVVTQIIVNNPGSGYSSAPTITLGAPGSGGIAATAVATIASAGMNYTSPPTITIAPPPPALTHPVLYVSGNTGVYQSIDGGQTWALFPSSAANLEGAPQNGGYLPNVKVTDLNLSIGAVNSTTGANVTQPGDSNLLTATTDGQGVFAIRLGPMIFPNSATEPDILGLDPSSFSGTVNSSEVTRVADPIIDGYSEQTTSGSDVYVSLYDMSNPNKPVLIGGFNPASEATATAAINVATGTVTSITIPPGGGGFGYTTPPAVVLSGGGFTSAATATAVLTNGVVTSITFTGGAGYTYAPTVSIALPPPSGNVTTNASGEFSIPIEAGYFKKDGTETIGIQATDAAGEIGNMQLLKFVLDTQAPTAPAPTLDPVSETGTFKNDNITNDNNAPSGTAYDAVNNFSLLSNPNGTWGYLYQQTVGSVSIPMPQTTVGTLSSWSSGQPAPNASFIEKNTTTSTITSGTLVLPTNLLDMDPQGGAAITEWTAPSSGLFTITGSFQGVVNGESSHPVEIVEDGSTVLLGPTTISTFGQVVNFSFTLNLSTGDTLDFIVNTGSVATNLGTGFDAAIKPAAILQAPLFDVGTTTNPVPAGATVSLYRTPVNASGTATGPAVLVNTLTSTAGGVVKIPDINQGLPALLQTPGPVIPDGTYVYSDVVTDLAGNSSPQPPDVFSPVITIDTAILVAPPPVLTPSSDTGLPVAQRDSDEITNIPLSTFQGTVGPNAVVALFVNNKAAGTATANAAGNYAITTTVPLSTGLNNVTIIETDEAGNVTLPSTATVVRLDTTTPPSITPTLAAFSDTGTSNSDTLTSTTTPTFTGTATPWQFLSANPTPQNNGTLVQIYLQLVTPTPTPTIPPTPTPTPLLENPVFLAGEALADPVTGLYNVTVGQFVNPLPAGDVDATATGILGTGLASGTVTGFTIVNGGSGYTSANPPTVTLIGGGGSNTGFISATAVATVNSSGAVSGITIVTPGSGYLTAPTVLIASPNLPSLAPGTYNVTAIQYDVAGNFSKPLTYGSPGAVVIDGTAADAPASGDNLGPSGTNEGGWLYMQQMLQLIQPKVANGQTTLVALGPDPTLGLTTGAAAAIASAFAHSTLPSLGWNLVYVVGPSNINAFLNGQPAVAYMSNGQPISGEMLNSNGQLVSGGITLGSTGLLYIPTVDETLDDLTDADLAVVNADGLQIANYVNGGGGLYAQAEAPSLATATATATATINNSSGAITSIAVTNGGAGYTTVPAVTLTGGGFTTPATATAVLTGGVVTAITFSGGSGYISAPTVAIAPPPAGITPWGWLTSIVPGAVPPVNEGPNGVTPLNVKITAAGQTVFPTLQVANITTGPWQNYFTGVVSPLSTVATEDFPSGTARSLILTAASVSVKSNTVTINTTPAATPPTPILAVSSETGPFNNDDITRDNNSTAKPSNAPVFDVGTAATSTTLPPNPVPPNTVVQLYRTPLNPATGQATGPAVLVNMVPSTASGVVAIPDINQTNPSLLPTPGPLIPDGTYLYQAVVVSVAGVASALGPGLTVTIVATPPVAPAPALSPTSDTGLPVVPRGSDDITDNASPVFIGTVEPGATVALFVGGKAAGTATANGTATAVASISGGMISGFTVTNGGAGYSSLVLPTITIAAPPAGGTQAAATAVVNVNDVITGLTVTNPGSGYTSPPTVTIAPPPAQLGAYSITTTLPLSQGLNSITIVETDLAGNPSTTSPALTVRLDTTPPPAITPTLASTNNGGVTNLTTPTFTGTAEVWPFLSPTPTALNNGSLVQIYLQPVVAAGQSPAPQFLAGEALANPLTGAYSVTVGQFVNPLPAGDVDATAGAVTVTGGAVTAVAVTGSLGSIAITNGGSGYTTLPQVTIAAPPTGGTTAVASAVVNNGSVAFITYTGITSITVPTNPGAGYSSANPPTVVISAPTGVNPVQATATAVISPTTGAITGFVITNPGSGYTAAPTVTLSGGSPTTAASGITATFATGTPGSGYPTVPKITIALPTGTNPVPATATATIASLGGSGYASGTVTTITVSNGGSGYTGVPTVTITPTDGNGSGAAATAVLVNGVITAINITNAGSGYTSAPTVTINGGGGTGATATAQIGALPTVTFLGGGSSTGFVPATAVAIVTNGVVTGITITSPGSGYATPPTVLIASPNLPALPQGSYNATAIQYDVAGNASQAVQFGNTGAVVIDGTDSPNHGDSDGPGGTNEDAWLYMQQVLNVIEPNITATSKTLVVLGADPAITTRSGGGGGGTGGTGQGLVVPAISSAFAQSNLPQLGWNIVFIVGATDMQSYLSGLPTETFNASDQVQATTVSLGSTGFLYIPTANHLADDIKDNELAILDQFGSTIKSYVNSGGGLYAETENPSGAANAPTPFGWLLSVFPGLQAVQANGGTVGLTISPAGQKIFPTLTTADFTGTQWHNYFTGNFSGLGLTVAVTAFPGSGGSAFGSGTGGGGFGGGGGNSTGTGVAEPLVLASTGGTAATKPLEITIITTPPAAPPAPVLEASSDTGASDTDGITQDNNSALFPAPIFDVGSAAAATATATVTGGVITTIAVVSGGSGYTSVPTVTISGGGGTGASAVAILTGGVVTGITITSAGIGYTSNPTITISTPTSNAFVEVGATVQLFRTPVNANGNATGPAVLANTLTNTAGGIVAIADVNLGEATTTTPSPVIPDGYYVYTAMVTDLAGNVSPMSPASQVVQIDTSAPAPLPQPFLVTDTGASSTDDVTDTNNSATAATATATINSLGTVTAIAVTFGGSGYSAATASAPVVTISGGGGSGATATAVLTNGVVTAINITNPGSGYSSAPTVMISSPPSNAPEFDAFNVLPDATVVLYRNNQEVSRVNLTKGGTVPIYDLNGGTQPGQNPIPDGVYVYRVQQIDAAGNASALSSGLTVTIDHTTPVTPFPPVLEASSDTSKGFDVTSKNNSPSPQNAPVFDVAQVVANASVFLYRAPVASTPATATATTSGGTVTAITVNSAGAGYTFTPLVTLSGGGGSGATASATVTGGVVTAINITTPGSGYTSPPTVTISSAGTFTQVNKVSSSAGGTVPIADINNGQGAIPDGSYIYEAQQFDLAGNASPITTPSTTITINTMTPPAPTGLRLDPNSDTGGGTVTAITVSNGGSGYTTAPTVTISGGGGTGATATAVLTNGAVTAITVTSAGYGYTSAPTVMITGSSAGTSAAATAQIGNYITRITLSAFPIFDISGVEGLATVQLFRVPVDPTTGLATGPTVLVGSLVAPQSSTALTVMIVDTTSPTPDGTYHYTAQQIDEAGNMSPLSAPTTVVYDTAQPPTPSAPTLDPASQTGGNNPPTTSVTAPKFDVSVTVSGAEVDSALTLLRDGQVVKQSPYTITSGTVQITDPGPVSDGTHVYQVFLTDLAGNKSALSKSLSVNFAPDAPSAPVLSLASQSSGIAGNNVTSFTTNLVFTVATAVTTNTVELFRAPASAPASTTLVGTTKGPGSITDPGPVLPGTYIYTARQVDPSNTVSLPSAPLYVTIVTTATAPTRVRLDPSSESGTPGSNVTDVTANLLFDVYGISAGTTVLLFENSSQVSKLTTADANATASIGSGTVTGFTVSSGGAGYTFTPQVTISGGGGTGATATAVLTNGVVTAINIASAGSGYTTVPTVTVTPPIATAMVTATISSGTGGSGSGSGTGGSGTGGMVSGFVIANGGSGYTSVPTVTISGGGGSGATASATVTNGVVTGITITSAGSGYTSAPTVAIAPPVGEVMISAPGPFTPNSSYQFAAEQEDAAGNISMLSPSVTIQIVAGATPALALAPGSDSGTSGQPQVGAQAVDDLTLNPGSQNPSSGLPTVSTATASLSTYNFGANAAALSAGSGGTVTAAAVTSSPSSASTSAGVTSAALTRTKTKTKTKTKHHKHVTASVVAAGAPAQTGSANIHDTALAALQDALGHRHKRGRSSRLT